MQQITSKDKCFPSPKVTSKQVKQESRSFTASSLIQHPMPSLWLIFKQQRGRTKISGSSFLLFRLAIIARKSDPDLAKYALVFCELRYIGVVTCGHQLIIPKSLQGQVISIYYEGHLGIMKTKQLLHSRVWFSGIEKSVEGKIASCILCQTTANSCQCEPLKMSPTPNGPWLQVSADFCGP